jgi:hypothetical protein
MQRGSASHCQEKGKTQQRTEERVRNSVGQVFTASAQQTQSKRMGAPATGAVAPRVDTCMGFDNPNQEIFNLVQVL